MFESGSQLRRAAKSVSANIVEGYGRKEYPSDYRRFLTIALASNDETREWLRYIEDCHTEHAALARELAQESDEIGRMMNRLIQSLD
jgi:four helix bundle protein